MGSFHVDCQVSSIRTPGKPVKVRGLLVDTGAEYSWIPEESLERIGVSRKKKDVVFLTADGRQITRDMGYAILRVDTLETVDEVVFGKPGDLKLLGARTLEGFPAVLDPRRKKLVAAGPMPVAVGPGASGRMTDKRKDPLWKAVGLAAGDGRPVAEDRGLLKLLAMGEADVRRGRVMAQERVFASLRARFKKG